MTDKELLNAYVDLVPFLSAVMGPGCEIVIHDFTDPNHSIIAIANSVSGRQVGDPMTELARKTQDQYASSGDAASVLDYRGRAKNDEFLSSSYFIKNKNRLVGMLCVNKELAPARELEGALKILIEKFNLTTPSDDSLSVDLNSPISGVIQSRISEIIHRSHISPKHMTRQEKIKVVHEMNAEGVLMMKGAITEIAHQLGVSVPTVYRYLGQEAE